MNTAINNINLNPYAMDTADTGSTRAIATQNKSSNVVKNTDAISGPTLKSKVDTTFVPQPLARTGLPPENLSNLFANSTSNDTSNIFNNWNQNVVFMAIDLLPLIEAQTKAIKTMADMSKQMLDLTDALSKALSTYAESLHADLNKQLADDTAKMHKAAHKGGILGIIFGVLEIFAACVCEVLAFVASVVTLGAASPALIAASSALALATADGGMKIDGGVNMVEDPDKAAKYEAQVQYGMYKDLGKDAPKVAIVVSLIMLMMTLGTSATSGTTQFALESISTAMEVAGDSMSLACQALSNAFPAIGLTLTNLLSSLTMISGMVAQLADSKPSKDGGAYEQMASAGLFALILYTVYHESGAQKALKDKGGEIADIIFQTVSTIVVTLAFNVAMQKGASKEMLRIDPLQKFQLSTFMVNLSKILTGMQIQMLVNQAGMSTQNIITTIKQNIMNLTQINMQLDQTQSNMDVKMIELLQSISQKLSTDMSDKSVDISKMIQNFVATMNNMFESYMANATR